MIPQWLTDKLAAVPEAGGGVHAWLFSCARQLHAHMEPAAVEAVLTAAVASCGRRVPGREIRDAVRNSHEVRWVRTGERRTSTEGLDKLDKLDRAAGAGERWPAVDAVARKCRIAEAALEGVAGLVDLWERSPIQHDHESADDWLDYLFPGADWLCLAKDHPATARSRRREKWSFGPADECGLVVPSPMTGPSGVRQDGQVSHRCLGNTGARRWLVIEFDSGSLDEQAALHWHLRAAAQAAGWPRLTLCVHSGKKSLHGWYGPVESEDTAKELFAYAVSLGADPPTWTRCQLVRLPGGVRTVEVEPAADLPEGFVQPGQRARLEVFFFDPIQCYHSQINSSAPGVR